MAKRRTKASASRTAGNGKKATAVKPKSSNRSTTAKSASKKHKQDKHAKDQHDMSPNADGPYPYDERMPKKEYEHTLLQLQIEMVKVQKWIKEKKQKILLIFEGRDAAGKGGTIKRFREHLNPRGARVVALEKPNETERGQWYFQRYIAQLPTNGEIVFFDRSWYNRAGVEPVMGFCDTSQYQRFLHQVPGVEKALAESGMWLFKLWFDVGREQQRKRIEDREKDPLKQWKTSPMDYESMNRWDMYTRARNAMLLMTDTPDCPWTVIRSDDKRRARIGAISHVLTQLPYKGKDKHVVDALDPLIVGKARAMYPEKSRNLFNLTEQL